MSCKDSRLIGADWFRGVHTGRILRRAPAIPAHARIHNPGPIPHFSAMSTLAEIKAALPRLSPDDLSENWTGGKLSAARAPAAVHGARCCEVGAQPAPAG